MAGARRRQDSDITSPQSNSDVERLRQEVERMRRALRLQLEQLQTQIDAIDTSGSGGAPLGASYVTASAVGLLTNERVLTAGAGITVTDNGGNSTIVIASSGGTTQEQVEDWVGALVVGGTGITSTYNDGAGTLTIASTITQTTQEIVEDWVAGLIDDTDTVTWTYNDALGSLTADVVGVARVRSLEIDFTTQSAGALANGADTFTSTDGTNIDVTIANVAASAVFSIGGSGLTFESNATNSTFTAATQTATAIYIDLAELYDEMDIDATWDIAFFVRTTSVSFGTNVTLGTGLGLSVWSSISPNDLALGIRRARQSGVDTLSITGASSSYTTVASGQTISTLNTLGILCSVGAIECIAGPWDTSYDATRFGADVGALGGTTANFAGLRDRSSRLVLSFASGAVTSDMDVTVASMRIEARRVR